ncbi:Glycosyl transferase, family 8-glycogenin [Phaffia rhodozyma]|uniref:glycogenin glucosyltransferase n=1 Tax=Phaffia rhodozyma TaxID=264483 RepID=A0A0F7SGF6_PHARH|nr:Glycosyl transferase, family 8-glycogenin [Phaffia rhodozyma]
MKGSFRPSTLNRLALRPLRPGRLQRSDEGLRSRVGGPLVFTGQDSRWRSSPSSCRLYSTNSEPTNMRNLVQLGKRLAEQRRLAVEKEEKSPDTSNPIDVLQLRKQAGEVEKSVQDCLDAEKVWNEYQDLLRSTPELEDLASEDLATLSTDRSNARLALEKTLVSLASSSADEPQLDQAPIIIEFSQGEGGPDSALWILNLFLWYEREFTRLGWRHRILESRTIAITGSKVGAWGYAKLIIEVWNPSSVDEAGWATEEGQVMSVSEAYNRWQGGVYGRFRWETGVHRLQMISEADKAGRIMTSAAVVYVIPTGPLTEGDSADVDILDMKDVRIDTMRSGGAGGQHVNTTDSAVRLVHLPTGITVSMQDSRSQPENKAKAIKVLRSRLLDRARQERASDIQQSRRAQIKGTGKGDRIRTYNVQQSRVTDHRIHLSIGLDDVEQGKGGFETLHEALQANETTAKLTELDEQLKVSRIERRMSQPTSFAFVTLLTSDWYLPGVLVLGHALRALHPSSVHSVHFKLVCIVTPETVDAASIKALSEVWDSVVGVEVLEHVHQSKGLELLGRHDLNTVLTKLHVFRLTNFAKVIFLDADVLPLRPITHLFALPDVFSASPDTGWPDCFNSGVLILQPSLKTFVGLMEMMNGDGESSVGQGSFDGGDQGILNQYFNGEEGRPMWNRISFTYNTTPTAAYTYAPAYAQYGRQIHCVHFIGAQKPWSTLDYRVGQLPSFNAFPNTEGAYDYGGLVDRWYAVYDRYVRPRQSKRVEEIGTWEIPKTQAAWNQPYQQGPSERLNLDELRDVATRGWTDKQHQGYVSLPLEGRVDLLRRQESVPPAPIAEPFPPFAASFPVPTQTEPQQDQQPTVHAPAPHTIQPETGIPYFAQWDPARSSPPKDNYQMQVDINQHYKNAWDLSGQEAKEQERAWAAGQGKVKESWKLPAVVDDGRYITPANPTVPVKADSSLPWNRGHRKTPSRVFPRGDTPPIPEHPLITFAEPSARNSSSESPVIPQLSFHAATPSPEPTPVPTPRPVLSFEEAMRSYKGNAWDSMPGIKNYANRLQGTKQVSKPSGAITPAIKGEIVYNDRGRRGSKDIDIDWRSQERSRDRGDDGDDEEEDSDEDDDNVKDGGYFSRPTGGAKRPGHRSSGSASYSRTSNHHHHHHHGHHHSSSLSTQYAVSGVQTDSPPHRDIGIQAQPDVFGIVAPSKAQTHSQPTQTSPSKPTRGRVWDSARNIDQLKQQNSDILTRFLSK